MTILEVIQRSAEFLAKKGVESPRLQVELLLAHVLKMPRMKLYLNFERSLSAPELDALRALVQRRAQREPLQYIVGTVSFCGFDLTVTPSVLIPRPETELLAERAWKFLQAPPKSDRQPLALDLCTGSGCLAIAIAANVPDALIQASDLSTDALNVARQNVTQHGLAERISLLHGDLFSPIDRQSKFALIVSNPPYIARCEIETLDPEVRDFEPRSALDGGVDGLDFVRRIAAESAAFLHPDGRLMLELEEDAASAASQIFVDSHWAIENLQSDYNGKPRILIARPAV